MKIFNTLTRQKEEFVPIEPGKVRMYACGPTVYNYIHIGNARPICVFDTLRRYLEYRGYDVTFVQNFTDIDDKLINKANEEGITVREVAERYIGEYMTDTKGLGIRPADIHPRATENIDTIINMVKTLEEKGFAYERDGSVYFRSRRFEEYGKPSWPSPWGEGRPGWHIECSAMIRRHLGDTIDIHCGGQDLIFPHHENEIAQSECCTGAEYVHYWMHNGYINVDNRKMSKSLGNFFTVREVAEKFGYEPIKFMMLQAHYRSPINDSLAVIEQCRAALERLHNCRDSLDFALESALGQGDWHAFREKMDARAAQFAEAMDDDLNTADGIAALFEMARDINTYIAQPQPEEAVAYAVKRFDELCGVLGLLYNRASKDLDSEVEALIAERQAARKAKDFARADAIRDQLAGMGILLKDTPQGVQWSRK